jgi:ferric-dicitrate binding protein FerR (iron transport regulator)
MSEDLFKNLTIRFLDGTATPHEKEILSNWLRQDPKAEEIFYFLVSKREKENPQYLLETGQKLLAYEEFLKGGKRMSVEPKLRYEFQPGKPSVYRLWLAASVLLVLSASLYFTRDLLRYNNYQSESGAIRLVTLGDGTRVTLNANSSLKVLRKLFSGRDREVWIDGEGFFEVEQNADRTKFIVHTTNFDVEVLGTKFNVNNRRGKSEVVLSEGKVKLVNKDLTPFIMRPGDRVSLTETQSRFEQSIARSKEYEAWRSSMLVFENTPLSEVMQIIPDYYDINVTISDSLLAMRQFTGTLPNNDLDVILLALSTAYNIDVERTDNRIILKPKALKQPQP